MLTATITAALIYFIVQSSGALALGTACWDERLSRAGRNSSCVGKFGSQPLLSRQILPIQLTEDV